MTATTPARIRKRRAKPGQSYESIMITLPKPQMDHLRSAAIVTGKSVAEQITEAVAATTGIGKDYLQDN